MKFGINCVCDLSKQHYLSPMLDKLKIIPIDLLETYLLQVSSGLQTSLEGLKDAELSTDTFSFYTSVSSVFSSKIEGEEIEQEYYIKNKKRGNEL